jgi:hypothetical protein
MTDDRTLERAARSWLEEGPTLAPDRAVEAALSQTQTIPQERDLRIPWRLPTMNPMLRVAGVVVVALVAIGVAALAFRPSADVGYSSTPPSVGPSAAPASPTAPPSPIPDGTYAVDLPVADILARLDREPTLTSEEKQSIVEEILSIEGATTLNLEIVVAEGQFTLKQGTDGSAKVSNKPWRMSVIDDHTVEFNAVDGPVNSRNEVVPGTIPGSFTLQPLSAPDGSVQAFVARTLFQTAPFIPTT